MSDKRKCKKSEDFTATIKQDHPEIEEQFKLSFNRDTAIIPVVAL